MSRNRQDDMRDVRDNGYPDPRRGRKRGRAGSVISAILLVAALCVFGYSAYKLYGYWREYHKGESEYSSLNDEYVQIEPAPETAPAAPAGEGDQTEDPGVILSDVEALEVEADLPQLIASARKENTEENGTVRPLPEMYNPVDFKELQEINPEVIGWIRVGGAGISYPVAQTDNNDFYLHHTFRKEAVFSGCIFENCDNSKFFTDQNTILYGHNMKDGSMFAALRKFWEKEDAIKNPYFWVFTPDFINQYRIFSCSIESKIGDPYRTRFLTEDFQAFLDKSKTVSQVDCGNVEVTAADRIVTLSTCTGDDSTRRIVQGKLQQVYVAKDRS